MWGGWDGSESTLLQLWIYLEEQYANLQRWPQGNRKHFLNLFFPLATCNLTWAVVQSVLNTFLTSEEHRIVQGKAQKEAFGLHTETLGDPARAAESIIVWKADPSWVVNAGESLKREHYRDCILAGVKRGAKQRSLNELQMVKQKPKEEPSEFLGRVCKAYWQYRYRRWGPREFQMVPMILIGQNNSDKRKKLRKMGGALRMSMSQLVGIALSL